MHIELLKTGETYQAGTAVLSVPALPRGAEIEFDVTCGDTTTRIRLTAIRPNRVRVSKIEYTPAL
jgi:hypothetical protein